MPNSPFTEAERLALRGEVLDSAGQVIAPFSQKNCLPLKTDQTLAELKWRGAADLTKLAGQPVRPPLLPRATCQPAYTNHL